jgi:hypothetical protein
MCSRGAPLSEQQAASEGSPDLPDLIRFVKAWLAERIPERVKFQVKRAAKYLGAFLGPSAGALMWSAAVAMWYDRASTIAALGAPISTTAFLYNSRAVSTLSYVSQFSLLPQEVGRRDDGLLSRLLHVPHNAFTKNSIYNLRDWGGAKLISPLVVAKATAMRAALCTLTTWRDALDMLKSGAEDHLPAKLYFKEQFWGSHWDSPAFAANLNLAALGFPKDVRHAHCGRRALERAEAAIKNNRLGNQPRIKVQREIYSALMCGLLPDDLPTLIKKRVKTLFGVSADEVDAIDFGILQEFMRTLPVHVATPVVKSWVNGWTTSERMHEDVRLGCIFGHNGCKDSMAHYMVCGRIWRAVAFARGEPYFDQPPLQRLCLRDWGRPSAVDLAVAFRVYHDLKFKKTNIAPGMPLNAATAAYKFITAGR